jgi:hypothetical protein
MKKLNVLILAAVVALSSAVVGNAQIRQGVQEVGFSGSYFHGTRSNDSQRYWNLAGTYGYFFSDQLELLAIAELQGQRGSSTTGHIGAGADWHFLMQGSPNFVPFAGSSYLFGVGSGTPDHLEAHIGLKQFITRNVAVKYQVGYGFDPSRTSDAGFRANIGLSYFF